MPNAADAYVCFAAEGCLARGLLRQGTLSPWVFVPTQGWGWGSYLTQKGIQPIFAEQPLCCAKSRRGHWGPEMTQAHPCCAGAHSLVRDSAT